MMKPITLPGLGRVETKSAIIGMAVLAILMIAPIPSNPLVSLIATIRDKVAGMIGGTK